MISTERKQLGAYYTPEAVAKTLVEWVVRRDDDRLLDPSCGDGEFLVCHRRAVGVDCDPIAASTAHLRAPWSRIHVRDFFGWSEETPEKFDCAAGNPPFIRYQRFNGSLREAALRVCGRLGVQFSALTSSWAPFIAATVQQLKPGGRMAFVVPAEIGHAPYAAPLLEFLLRSFSTVQIIAIRRKMFPDLSEDAWLLYAEGLGGAADGIRFTRWDAFKPTRRPPRADVYVSQDQWRRWGRRLRPFLIESGLRDLYADAIESGAAQRFGELANVGIGYVTGANEFFYLRPSAAREAGIPDRLLMPAIRNGRQLPADEVTNDLVRGWLRADAQVLLLRIRPDDLLPPSVIERLSTDAGQTARQTYKCRNREPWYVVPDVHIPDAFMSYMSGNRPILVANRAGCVCTNSVHAVFLKDKYKMSQLRSAWDHPLTEFSCELEGHPLGGGLLKLEPREARSVAVPSKPSAWSASQLDELHLGTGTLRGWRHHLCTRLPHYKPRRNAGYGRVTIP